MGINERQEFVKRLRNYEQGPCCRILTMDEIHGLTRNYDIETILKKCIAGMKERNIKSHIIKLDEESEDSLKNMIPLEDIEISLLLAKFEGGPLGVIIDGHLLRMEEHFLLERESGQRYYYITIDYEAQEKSLDDQR